MLAIFKELQFIWETTDRNSAAVARHLLLITGLISPCYSFTGISM